MASKLQRLAMRRNWALRQVSAAYGQLKSVACHYNILLIDAIEEEQKFRDAINRQWQIEVQQLREGQDNA